MSSRDPPRRYVADNNRRCRERERENRVKRAPVARHRCRALDNERSPRDGSPFNSSLPRLFFRERRLAGRRRSNGAWNHGVPRSPRIASARWSSSVCRASFSTLQRRANGAFAKKCDRRHRASLQRRAMLRDSRIEHALRVLYLLTTFLERKFVFFSTVVAVLYQFAVNFSANENIETHADSCRDNWKREAFHELNLARFVLC